MTRAEAIDILRVINPPRESKRIFDEFMQARDIAIKALEEPHWIPCSSRLPDDGTEVFVYLFNNPKSPYIAWIEDNRWYTEEFEVDKEHEPLAWMPLPEAWRGDAE